MNEGIEIIDPETGGVVDTKPYRTEQHLGFGKELAEQQRYVNKTLNDPDNPNVFTKLSADNIVELLDHLSSYYNRLGWWLANQKLWHNDLKTTRELEFSKEYLKFKRQEGQTNETARMEAKIAVNYLDVGIDKCRHQLDIVEAWKKSIGRWHDSARSSLSWEKQQQYMTRRNDQNTFNQ